jgi:hypothetical protein
MTAATWIAILVLGPGSVAVFAFFLLDLKSVMGERGGGSARDRGAEEPGPR